MQGIRCLLYFSLVLATLLPFPSFSQTSIQEESLDIYTEHPRLFLRPQRLKLLRREKERRSMRWLQFETLVAGRAPMPEPGFAEALYYQASGDEEAGRQAVRWALGASATDLRQLALVFDWCQPVLTEAQSKALAAKIEKGLAESEKRKTVSSIRARALAAVAVAGHSTPAAARHLEWVVRTWWAEQIIPAVKAGRNPIPREDVYALLEILHVVRDNVNIDLRLPIPGFFKNLPLYHLLSYYPATFPAAENEFRVPFMKEIADPDLTRAAFSRAADLIMVAYDVNAPESQVLQGWLMHDRFLMRGTLGITYEFLWANPYQPGLSYYHVPLIFHDEELGRLFVRSSWEDSATWIGYQDGELQIFQDGRPSRLRPELSTAPLVLDEAVILFGSYAEKFKITLKESEAVFVLGLKPRLAYDIEIDDQEIIERRTDPGGILSLKLPVKTETGVRMRAVGSAR